MTAGALLVTGAAGFIGSHVCRDLVRAGWAVRGLDDFDSFYDPAEKRRRAAELARLGCEMLEGDVRDPAVCGALLAGAAAVVHLAARPGVRQSVRAPAVCRAVNVGGTAALLDACAAHGVTRLVLASSSSVYGRGTPVPFREDAPLGAPSSPYAASKRQAEALVRRAAAAGRLRGAVLRLFSVYGPHQRPDLALRRFTAALRSGRPIDRLGEGSATRDYTHVRDVVRAVRAALDWTARQPASAEVFNVGSGRPVRLDSLIAALGRALGVEPVVRSRPAHPADLPATWADRRKAERVLGWAPHEELEAGVAEFVAWYGDAHGHESRSAA